MTISAILVYEDRPNFGWLVALCSPDGGKRDAVDLTSERVALNIANRLAARHGVPCFLKGGSNDGS